MKHKTPKAPDWSVFRPVIDRIADLMSDGKPRSVLHVCEALNLASNCHARTALAKLETRGTLTSEYQKIGRHAVIVYAARAGTARRPRIASVGR